MKRDKNKVELSGRVHCAPESAKTHKCIPVTKTIISNVRKNSKHFFNIVAYGDNADKLRAYKEGDEIFVRGHLQQEKWFSRGSNRKLSKLVIIVDEV